MKVTEDEIATKLKLLQPLNAKFPTKVTESGISTEDNGVQPLNALIPI